MEPAQTPGVAKWREFVARAGRRPTPGEADYIAECVADHPRTRPEHIACFRLWARGATLRAAGRKWGRGGTWAMHANRRVLRAYDETRDAWAGDRIPLDVIRRVAGALRALTVPDGADDPGRLMSDYEQRLEQAVALLAVEYATGFIQPETVLRALDLLQRSPSTILAPLTGATQATAAEFALVEWIVLVSGDESAPAGTSPPNAGDPAGDLGRRDLSPQNAEAEKGSE